MDSHLFAEGFGKDTEAKHPIYDSGPKGGLTYLFTPLYSYPGQDYHAGMTSLNF